MGCNLLLPFFSFCVIIAAEEVHFVNRLKELREARGWNITEAAARLGFPKNTYRNYESGERGLNSELLIKFADFYGVSIDYLLGREDKVHVLRSTLDEKYQRLDAIGKKAVEAVLDVEASRKVIDLSDVAMVARGGKKIPAGYEGDLKKMVEIMLSDAEE